MTKASKLKLCNQSLLFLTIGILTSGVYLEFFPDGPGIWVWLHIVLGTIFIGSIFWHIGLHRTGKKRMRPKTQNHPHRHKTLGVLFLLTLLSGIIATIHWAEYGYHSTIGGIHGKIGFLFIIAILFHIAKKRRFYIKK